MFLIERRYKMDKKTSDEFVKALKDKDALKNVISVIPGYHEWHWVDFGNGVFGSVAIFESRASAEESTRKAAEWIKKNAGHLSISAPEVHTAEVLLGERLKSKEPVK
jgi:hypothetical protein